MLKYSRVDRIRKGYRLPPRISCQKSLTQFNADPVMFHLHYLDVRDRQKVLDVLSNFDWASRAAARETRPGSHEPTMQVNFCVTNAIQAICKIGFNLLAFCCPSTPINLTTFPRTVRWITSGDYNPEFGDVQKFGFIRPAAVNELQCPPRSHKFRLVYDISSHTWKMYAAFFEGKVAAYVAFDGPHHETWSTMEVIAPYDKPMLPPTFDAWYRPIATQPTMYLKEILPSLPWTTGECYIRCDPVILQG